MRKTSFLIAPRFIMPSLIILSILFAPFFAYAGTLYSCIDKEGNETLSDYPLGGKTCKPIGTFEGMTHEESENYKKDREKKGLKNTKK